MSTNMELTVDQTRIINNSMSGHCLIKGVAGSGKTTVALCKIVKFLEEIPDSSRKVLVVTYNKTLIQYMKWLSECYHIDLSSKRVDIKTIDSIIYQYASKNGRKLVSSSQQREMMQWAVQKITEQFGEETVVQRKNLEFLMEEIEWIKSCHYVTREEYLAVDRTGRYSIGDYKMRLQKQSQDREAIFSLYQLYESQLEQKKLTDFQTNALTVRDKIQSGKIVPERYQYIIVDESQDLTRVQLEIIRGIYQEGGNILFVADVAQSIYSHSWLSKQTFKSVGFDMSGRSNILSKNFRTTKQIALAAYSLLNHDRDLRENADFVEPVAIERNGSRPRYDSFTSEADEFSFVAGEIKKLVSEYALKDIAIVARNHAYLKRAQTYLLNHGVDAALQGKSSKDHLFEEDKVSLFTLHGIKGLEFSVVFIVGLNRKAIPYYGNPKEVERKLLYVGMTRARNLLYLTNSAAPSVFLKEIPKGCLAQGKKQEGYYDVCVDKYQGGGNVRSGEEEQVRQWYIEQLKLTYGYPEQSIELEYPLQYGSRKYYVDLAVLQKAGQMKRPYIMVEVKRENEDLKSAMKQMESYLVPGNVPEYVVVVNGRDRIVKRVEKVLTEGDVDFRLVPVDDIPEFQQDTCDVFEYTDFLHKQKYSYKRERKDKKKLFLPEGDGPAQEAEGMSLRMMGSVAAGTLKYINASVIEEEVLPSAFVSSGEPLFSLTVEGDSMVDFGIFNRDKIIVRRQSSASVGDIVVAGNTSTDEITLKQFFYDNDSVVLHPGNREYQDIRINMQDFFINGVVVGAIHKIG